MIGYVTLGSNDLERSVAFYEPLLAVVGAKRLLNWERMIGWGPDMRQPILSVIGPWDGKDATVGNGVMVALVMDSRAKVDALYNKAMDLGAKSEGELGDRGDNFYAGYFRDPDGNKLCVYCTRPE